MTDQDYIWLFVAGQSVGVSLAYGLAVHLLCLWHKSACGAM